MTLATRLTVVMVSLAMLVVATSGVISYAYLHATVLPAELARLELYAVGLGGEIADTIEAAREDLLATEGYAELDTYVRVHAATGLAGADERACRARIETGFLTLLNSHFEYAQVRLIGLADGGRELIRVNRSGVNGAPRVLSAAEMQAAGDRVFFQQAVRIPARGIYVSPIEIGAEGGGVRRPIMRIATPVPGPDGSVFGLLVINIDMRGALDRIRRANYRGGRTYLADGRGEYLVHPEAAKEFGGPPGRPAGVSQDFPLLGARLDGRAVTATYRDPDGRLMGLAAVPLALPSRYLSITAIETVPLDSLLAGAAAIRRSSIEVGLVTALIALLVARYMARWLTRPLEEMSAAVAAYPRDDSLPLPVHEPGTVGALAQAIARMKKKIGEATAALRLEVEERLRTEETLAGLISAMPNAIVVTDATRKIYFANSAATELFGASRDQLLRGTFQLPLEPGRISEVEIPRDGGARWVELFVVPVEWRTRSALLATLIDRTERRRLADQLRQAQKMEAIGRLAGGVAHDFNNLLTVINLSAEMVLGDPAAADPKVQKLVGEIRASGKRAAALTNQLLAFSRKAISAPRPIDVNAVIRELEKMLRRLIGEDIVVTTSLAPDLGLVFADPAQLEQIILNLTVNARDAMASGGSLAIETHNIELDAAYAGDHVDVRPGRYVLLEVSDTGVGMTPEIQARVFEPFFTTKKPGEGTGLGLAIVFGIVKQAGGHILVYSEPGRGTTFKVYLPQSDVARGSTPPVPPTFTIATGHETVLLVEDDEAIRQLSRMVLEACGYAVVAAEDGAGALTVAGDHPGKIDLLITDVVMPQMDGRHLLEELRRARPGVRVLFMSGYTDDMVIRHGVTAGSLPFLQKPFTPASLANKVREVLDSPTS